MAKLKKSDVLHVAKLAKLKLTEEEIEKFTPQLSNIVDFVGQLSEVDIKGIDPTSQTTGLENVYRKDEARSSQGLTQDEAISGTDETHNGYFKVDAILTERSDK
ncbi:MAG: aspartyl/glutamyl-tRNA amidotransferase subunit C [Candidatus Woesebacteria bacterium GW2011_GWB1_45_5]|uniref:Aspartyl/glutamyl-tRNA(Asn/Gln) amidotransferase subunit C n=1 Tax=Candidatus Woesebacteria bacterium GW2011_GWB1_45_5 TaxID=1618581 RepID=A0A0G1MM15_9BACT|nr:MAG: aspartyl/glutamyl-tRNA amidotransferase subunit C [Candidatus Woesebacteria bacterium GW2011_GWB1_45_5]